MTRLRNAPRHAIAALLAAVLILPARAAEVAPELSATLVSVFADWSKAMKEGDAELWQKTTAQYRQIGMRNTIVSQKQKWPGALFEAIVDPPDISAMKLARVMEKGATAQLVYYGKADFGIGIDAAETPDGMLFLMFVKEKTGWKFNTSRFMSLKGAEEVGDQAQAGDFSFIDIPDFQPPGSVPPLPKLCPIPELVGYVEIVSIGYQSVVDVGGRSEHTVIDNVQKGLIIGGLKKGINPIRLKVRPLPASPDAPKDAKRHFEFSVYRKTPDPSKPLKRVYHSGPLDNPGTFQVIVRGDG